MKKGSVFFACCIAAMLVFGKIAKNGDWWFLAQAHTRLPTFAITKWKEGKNWKEGSCSVVPEKACSRYCLQPAWTQQVHNATRLSCCKPDDRLAKQTVTKENLSQLTIALLYTNEQEMLRRQVQNWMQLSAAIVQKVRFIIAGERMSPWGIIEAELQNRSRSSWPKVDVIRIEEEIRFNIGGKRNLLVHVAEQPSPSWVFLTDVDMEFSEPLLAQMLLITSAAGSNKVIHKFNRRKPNGEKKMHPGTWLMRSELYWRAGGCDEDFVGSYGFTDVHFDHRAALAGIATKFHSDLTLHELPHGLSGKRDTARNGKLLNQKLKNGSWSNHFLRFSFEWSTCAAVK